MKLKILLAIIILTFSGYAFSDQASWSYSIWFILKDKHGKIINKHDYAKNGIKLLSAPFGVHSNNSLVYDNLTNSFRFSQHTVVTSSVLVFIQKQDTTIIEVSTKDLYLSELSLTNNTYDISIWNNENDFICQKELQGYKDRLVCESKVPLETFIIEQKGTLDIENLVEVKLEI